jgi:hypothetical protein
MTRFDPVIAAVVAICLTGCAPSEPAPAPEPGTLAAGTVHVTVDDHDLGDAHAVRCVPIGSLTTITTGDQTSGISTVVSNGHGLAVKSITMRDVAGFTGSYYEALDGSAQVSLVGATYSITGTAVGFATADPSRRVSRSFIIAVSC